GREVVQLSPLRRPVKDAGAFREHRLRRREGPQTLRLKLGGRIAIGVRRILVGVMDGRAHADTPGSGAPDGCATPVLYLHDHASSMTRRNSAGTCSVNQTPLAER